MVRHAFLGSVKEENFGAGKSGCGLNSGVFLGPYHMARFWMKLLKQTSGVNNTNQTQGETLPLLSHTCYNSNLLEL